MGIYKHSEATTQSYQWDGRSLSADRMLTLARQSSPLHQQGFEQQHAIEVGLAQDFLALAEDPSVQANAVHTRWLEGWLETHSTRLVPDLEP